MNDLGNITVTDITDIFRVMSPRGRKETMQNRNHFGLSFCISGKITYRQGNRNIISDPQHAIILPKGGNYEIYGNKPGIFPVINFECTDFLCNKVTAIPIHDAKSYINDFEQMKNLNLFPQNRAGVFAIFYGILHRISRKTPKGYGILEPAIEYIESHYSDSKITNKVLADMCSISEVYFRKLFKKMFDTTPKQYILDIRLQKARQLLSEGRYKVNAVSEMCGFSGQYHFSRIFREKVGLSATEYMKENINLRI